MTGVGRDVKMPGDVEGCSYLLGYLRNKSRSVIGLEGVRESEPGDDVFDQRFGYYCGRLAGGGEGCWTRRGRSGGESCWSRRGTGRGATRSSGGTETAEDSGPGDSLGGGVWLWAGGRLGAMVSIIWAGEHVVQRVGRERSVQKACT